MCPFILLPQYFAYFPHVDVGRFVGSIHDLDENFHDSLFIDNQEHVSSQEISHECSGDDFRPNITEVLADSLSKRFYSSIELVAESATEYRLRDERSGESYQDYLEGNRYWLAAAIDSIHTQKWLEDKINKEEEIYMIVGLMTVSDARVKAKSSDQNLTDDLLDKPASIALAELHAAVPMSLRGIPTIQKASISGKTPQLEIYLPGEWICAVKLQRVRWGFASRRQDMHLAPRPSRIWWEVQSRKEKHYSGIEVDLKDAFRPRSKSDMCEIDSGAVIVEYPEP